MEIDILKAKKEFKEYVKNYDPEDKKIMLKIRHIERVAEVARKTAEYLNLSEEDTNLAELIGLLHDIGRFEQIKRYHTFLDKKSINHGAFGVQVLFEEGLIRKFIETDKYDEIIKKAILNHNKPKIEEGLNERELLHAKIIRDSDKTDIYYVQVTEPFEAMFGKNDISDEKMSDKIYKQFVEDKLVKYEDIQSNVDSIVAQYGYIYDFYFDYIKQVLNENKYLDIFYSKLHFKDTKTQERIEEIYKIAKEYIEK